MKNNRTKNYCGLAVATLLLSGANLTLADTPDLTLQDFTANAKGTGVEWGSSTVALDTVVGDPAGSLAFTVTFGGASDSPMVDFVCADDGNPWYQPTRINFSQYTNITFDIKWDPTSEITLAQFNDLSTWPVDLTNSLGQTVFISWARTPGYLSGSTLGIDIELCGGPAGQRGPSIGLTNIPAAAASGWAHCAVPINPTMAQIDGANGIVFNKWIKNQWGIEFPVVARFWIDNVVLEGIHAPIPPPTVSIAPAHPGLHLFAGTAGAGDRESIRTTNALTANYSWVGRGSTPVSYSFTITNYPGSNTPYFMLHTLLIPVPYDRPAGTNGTVGLESAPDWNEPTCIYMDLENYNDGSGDWRFRYKTNSPGSNGKFNGGNNGYYDNLQAELRDPAGVLGTWTLTFVNNTNVTMTSPKGLTTNFVFSSDDVSWFADNSGAPLPLYYYIGCRENGAGPGVGAVVSRVSIQGSVDTLDDNFLVDACLDTNKWQMVAAYGPSVQLVPATPKPVYWVDWTLPAKGFTLESGPSLEGPWTESITNQLAFSGAVKCLVTGSCLPGASSGFFRMNKRDNGQLQVLLPGESNAPNTPTGKTGTPNSQTLFNTFDITVNRCDATWHIVPSSDTVAITSSDTMAGLPPNTALVNGTATISGAFYFSTSGTWTITATDITTTNVSAGASSPITIP